MTLIIDKDNQSSLFDSLSFFLWMKELIKAYIIYIIEDMYTWEMNRFVVISFTEFITNLIYDSSFIFLILEKGILLMYFLGRWHFAYN